MQAKMKKEEEEQEQDKSSVIIYSVKNFMFITCASSSDPAKCVRRRVSQSSLPPASSEEKQSNEKKRAPTEILPHTVLILRRKRTGKVNIWTRGSQEIFTLAWSKVPLYLGKAAAEWFKKHSSLFVNPHRSQILSESHERIIFDSISQARTCVYFVSLMSFAYICALRSDFALKGRLW